MIIIAVEAIIVTDAYKSYVGLNKKYNHVVVKHQEGGYITRVGDYKFHTQNIENFWSIFKRSYIGIYHYMSKKHLHRYTTEFGYRYNTRGISSVERFEDALKSVSTTRITYNKLTEKA